MCLKKFGLKQQDWVGELKERFFIFFFLLCFTMEKIWTYVNTDGGVPENKETLKSE